MVLDMEGTARDNVPSVAVETSADGNNVAEEVIDGEGASSL